MRKLTVTSVLLLACAASVTWAWNTIVPELSGLARFRFSEGLSLAVTTLLVGAVFEAGRCLVGEPARSRHASSEQ
jgi:hypothetical protein